jgi:hypothetical protein
MQALSAVTRSLALVLVGLCLCGMSFAQDAVLSGTVIEAPAVVGNLLFCFSPARKIKLTEV